VTAYDQCLSRIFQLDPDAFTVNSTPKGKKSAASELTTVSPVLHKSLYDMRRF